MFSMWMFSSCGGCILILVDTSSDGKQSWFWSYRPWYHCEVIYSIEINWKVWYYMIIIYIVTKWSLLICCIILNNSVVTSMMTQMDMCLHRECIHTSDKNYVKKDEWHTIAITVTVYSNFYPASTKKCHLFLYCVYWDRS
jgi:hypothetical protein